MLPLLAMWTEDQLRVLGGDILCVSGPLPGSVHDKKAAWVWGVLAELEAVGLIVLADKGYQGAAHAKVPYRGKNKPESQEDANRAHAQLRSPGERPSFHTATLVPQARDALAAELSERGRTPVLLIDEAHLFGHDALEAIRLLTNHELDTGAPFATILLGQPRGWR
jgi:hypothetical protein